MKTIRIDNIKVKEIRIGITQGKLDGKDYYDMSVLYQQVTDDGNLLPPQWSDPIKNNEVTPAIINRVEKIIESVVLKAKERVGI